MPCPCGDGDYSSPLQKPKIDRRRGWLKTTYWLALAGDGNHLFFPTAKAQNRQATRVDKNDPIAFPCGDGDYSSPPQKPQIDKRLWWIKTIQSLCLAEMGTILPHCKSPKIDRRQGWLKTTHWLALARDGLSVLSLPQKVQSLRKNISRKKRTPSHKNKPKTAAPGGGRVFGAAGGPQARRRSRRGERSSPARLRRAACGPHPGCCRNFSTEQGKFVQNHHHFILP